MKVMKETPINDFFAKNGKIREDGRMTHDMYLFEVKRPHESQGPWDLYKLVATLPVATRSNHWKNQGARFGRCAYPCSALL